MLPRIIILTVTAVLLTLPATVFSQSPQGSPEANETIAQTPREPNQLSFPYIAEITATNVNIRSGPGMNYYRCAELSSPNTVTVVGEKLGWLKIVPPAQSFSWISKQFIRFEPNTPKTGIVTGDEVRVWAGSPYVEPMHSTSLQTKLNIGDSVKLTGREKGDYYQIIPPPGAFLWISAQYTEPLRIIDEIKPPPLPEPEPEKPTAAQVKESLKAERLKQYYQLAEQVKKELKKPAEKQNYTKIQKQLASA